MATRDSCITVKNIRDSRSRVGSATGRQEAMEISEILNQFELFNGKFPREAVEAAITRKEEITPELLRVLEEIADQDRARQLAAEHDYMAHLYAMFLLAQFREARAYPLVVKISMLPSDLLDLLFGDFITEHLGSVLASVCDGDMTGIQSIIEDPDADEWVRGAALASLETLVAAGMKTREEVLGYFAELFRGRLTDRNEIVWSDLVVFSTDLYATDLLADIERACEEGLVDPTVIDLEDVTSDFARGEDSALARLADNPHRKLVHDTVKEFGSWYCFNKEKDSERKRAKALAPADPIWADVPAPYRRTAPKIGRNDPCPCASGKKYKKCCGQ